jgi:hypothetical protein
MENLYFACHWIIDRKQAQHISHISTKVAESGGEVSLLEMNNITNQGYIYDVYAIRLPSKDALEHFVEQIGVLAGLTNWYSISQEEYLKGRKCDFENMSPLEFLYFIDSWETRGTVNEQIKHRGLLPLYDPNDPRFRISIGELDLDETLFFTLKQVGIITIGDLLDALKYEREVLLKKLNLKTHELNELVEKLRQNGYWSNENDM